METQAPALPVPPLTEEQKAESPFAWLPETPAIFHHLNDKRPVVGSEVLRMWAQQVGGEYKAGVGHIRIGVENMVDLLAHARQLEAENTRLSHLLEEERRTGGQFVLDKVAEVLQAHTAALAGQMSVRDTVDESLMLGQIAQDIADAFKPAAPAPTCQRDCQKCEKAGGGAGVGLQGEEGGGNV